MRTGIAILFFGFALTTGCDRVSPAPPPTPKSKTSPPQAAPDEEPLKDRVAYAKQLLAEAGYPEGKGFPKLEILYNTDEGHKKIAAAIQQMWRKNLGINVELRNTEWKVYLDDQSKLRYQIVRRGWIGDYRDPNTFVEMFTSNSGNNNTGWTNAEYDRFVKAAGAEADAKKRYDLLRQAEKILMHELPILPLYYYISSNCWPDALQGVYRNILDVHPLNEVFLEGKDTLVINNGTEVQSLDPAIARGVPEHRILMTLLEGLTTYDPKTCEAREGVAERWEISPDGKKYTFHLRACRWSDGKNVTAHDFEYAWKRVLNPATPTDYAHQLFFVKGAEAYNQKKTPDPETVGVRARDDKTLDVELENPCPFFLEVLAHFVYMPVRKDLVEKYGTDWTRPENYVGNGPFLLKEHKPTDYLLIEKNPKYWNAAKVKQPRVKWLPIENRSTTWNLYLEGSCDWVTTLPLDQMESIVKRPDYRGDTYLGTYFYSFNITVDALKDRRVRKALALAIDREVIVSKITKQGQQPAYAYTPPAWKEYTSPRFDIKD